MEKATKVERDHLLGTDTYSSRQVAPGDEDESRCHRENEDKLPPKHGRRNGTVLDVSRSRVKNNVKYDRAHAHGIEYDL